MDRSAHRGIGENWKLLGDNNRTTPTLEAKRPVFKTVVMHEGADSVTSPRTKPPTGLSQPTPPTLMHKVVALASLMHEDISTPELSKRSRANFNFEYIQ